MAESLEFRLLGSLDAVRGDETLEVGGPKHRTLLALLLLHANEPVAVDVLAEALWPERPPPKFGSTLQVYVSQLRGVIGRDAIVRRGPGYVLTVDPERVDVLRFQRLAGEGRGALEAREPQRAHAVLEEALALWRGPALADFRYDAFALPHAERLEEYRLAAVEARMEADLALARGPELVPELQALVAEHPVRERFRAQLMVALYRSGRQADALAAYQSAREALVEELGIEPSTELKELHRMVLAQDSKLAGEDPPGPTRGAPRAAFPAAPTPLIGRREELETAVRFLVGERRVLTLTGSGGTGKTRLALEILSQLAAQSGEGMETFADGVFWVPLQALADPELVLPTIAATLGAEGDLAGHVDQKRMLLLLDNLEQLLPAASRPLSELLAACPNLKLLVTSRAPLRIAAERELALDPLPLADAVTLFRERAAHAAPEEAVREICCRLDGLPLAVELAAARTRLLPPSKLLARLAPALPLLSGGARDAPERQRTLRATITWSYDLLDGAEQRLFARLAVFSGSFDLESAENVVDADLDALESLVEKSLVRRWASGRFGMLETIHEFARERLEAADDAAELKAVHAAWYTRLAAAAEVRGPEHAVWLERLSAEHANFREALQWLHEQGHAAEELALASNLGEYAYHSGALPEGRRWLDRAVLRAAECPDELRARGLAFAALAAAFEGDLGTAVPRAEEAEAVSMRCSPAVRGEALRALALIRSFQGAPAEAARLDIQALELARANGFETLAADVANNLGYASLHSGDLAGARALLSESVASARGRGDAIVLSVALSNLALVELMENSVDEAARCWAEALEIARTHSLGPATTAALVGVAALMGLEREHHASARVLGAVDAAVRRAREPLQALEREVVERAVSSAREALGADEAEAALAGGRHAEPEHVVHEAVAWLADRAATGRRPS